LIQYRSVTDTHTHTDRQTHDDGIYRACKASRGKNRETPYFLPSTYSTVVLYIRAKGHVKNERISSLSTRKMNNVLSLANAETTCRACVCGVFSVAAAINGALQPIDMLQSATDAERERRASDERGI